MNAPAYGQQAPKSQDGLLLLQERILTPEQAAAITLDRDLVKVEATRANKKRKILLAAQILVCIGLLYNCVALLSSNLPDWHVTVTLFAAFMSVAITSQHNRERRKYNAAVRGVAQSSTVTPLIREMTSRYDPAPGTDGMAYLVLLKGEELPIRKGSPQRLRLISEDGNPHLIQEVSSVST